MLYFLISFILFFTSAQSSDNQIVIYYSALTGEFQDTPKSILLLTQRLSLGLLHDIKYYQNIPQKLIELGFFLPGNIASFENLISEILTLADYCYHGEISFPSISSVSQDNKDVYIEKLSNLIKKKYEFYEKLNAFYAGLKDYFLKNHITLGINTLPEIPEFQNPVFMAYLIDEDLNLLTPHKLGVIDSSNFRPKKYGSKLKSEYVLLLLNLKDQEKIEKHLVNILAPYLYDYNQESLLGDLTTIFQFRDRLLEYPLNEYGYPLEEFIKNQHFVNLSDTLKKKTMLSDSQIKTILNEYSKNFF